MNTSKESISTGGAERVRKNVQGDKAKDQLVIDKLIIKNCKRRKTGLGMAWIGYKKAIHLIWFHTIGYYSA